MQTLNSQYQKLKKGKGHKGMFLTEAKKQFPNYIRTSATFHEAEIILKQKGIISENIIGIPAINTPFSTNKKTDFELAFEKFLKEGKAKKEGGKAEEKKVPTQVEDELKKAFPTSDKKNPDNMIFGQIMAGYYTEMKDPKNSEKTMQELKDIVFKNLEKDPIYYVTNAQFGIKDIGYSTDNPGLGEPKEAKGKYKASGYGNLSESLELDDEDEELESTKSEAKRISKEEGVTQHVEKNGRGGYRISDWYDSDNTVATYQNGERLSENEDMTLQETQLRKVINKIIREELSKKQLNENVDKRLKEIELEAAHEALGAKMEKIVAEIEKRQTQLGKLDEDEDLKAMMDKKATSKIQKEIKLLERAKSKIEKQLGKEKPKEVIDETDEINEDSTQMYLDQAAEMYDKEYSEKGTVDIDVIASKFPAFFQEDIKDYLQGYTTDTDSDY